MTFHSYKRADQCNDDGNEGANELTKVSTEPTSDKDALSESSKDDSNGVATYNEKSSLCKKHITTEAGCSSSDSGTSNCYDAISINETTGLLSSQYGTVKKSVINSPYGFLFTWAQKYEAGNVPLYSLLLAIFCSTVASVMLLFAYSAISNWWFILILVVLILTSLCSITLIVFFVQDDSIKTFKVCKITSNLAGQAHR